MIKFFCILMVALLMEAVGVVYLSKGVKEIGEVQQFSAAEVGRVVKAGFSNGYVWLGLGLETAFFILLLVLLHGWDVSLVWPLTSLGFILTTLAAQFIRGEQVSFVRWGGVILIMLGAALVGYSEALKKGAGPPAQAGSPADLK